MNEVNDPFWCRKYCTMCCYYSYVKFELVLSSIAAKGDYILFNQYQLSIALEHNNNLRYIGLLYRVCQT